jgi:DNA-binding transcriptional MerR regulator
MIDEINLEDLVQLSGLSLRTLRYYIQEGLLQGPDTRGKFAHYSQQHLERIELIQRLKNLHLPLQEIRRLLENMTPDEIKLMRQYQENFNRNLGISVTDEVKQPSITETGTSALEYIQNLSKAQGNISTSARPPVMVPLQRKLPIPDRSTIEISKNLAGPVSEQGTWRRIVISDGVELNLREDVVLDNEFIVRKLIEFTQQLIGNKP